MLFRVMAGRHLNLGKTYSKGDIVETSMDLIAMFGDLKFKREIELEIAQAKSIIQSSVLVIPESTNDLGNDLTARFPIAQENGYNVFKKDGFFFVSELDEKKMLNNTPLKRSQVIEFIEGLVQKQ